MRFRVLGPVEVRTEAELSLGGRQQRLLLALLIAARGRPVSVDRLVEDMWGDDAPDSARKTIQVYVHRLRAHLGDALVTVGSGYRLDTGDDVDALHFERLHAEAALVADSDPERALALLDEALGCWRGDAYAGLESELALVGEVARLDELRVTAMADRIDAGLALGRHDELVGEIEELVRRFPLRERFRAHHMLALHRAGRQVEALRSYQAFRDLVIDEAGVEPSADLVALDRAIAANDPALAVPDPGGPVPGYEVHELVGAGAFAEVYRGVQPVLDRDVAIKAVRAEYANRPEFIRGFESEARIVAALEHPHIVPLYDFWREPDRAYLVMRWLPGGTLESSLDAGRWTVEQVARMVEQVGSALAAAHRAGVVHRDVKSANILLDAEGNAYLGDFGIAVVALGEENPAAALSEGSPAYASPEQLRREEVGPAADIHGLAIATYEALVGRLPFPHARDRAELLRCQLNDPIPSVHRQREDVPASVDDVLARATAKQPGDRFAAAGDFVVAFVEALASTAAASVEVSEIAARVTALRGEIVNPYKGLQAFGEADAAEFHGRERLVDELLGHLGAGDATGRLLALIGASGSGKSSVVRAGLLPALRAGRLPGSDRWFVTTMTPGTHPYESLETALLRVAVNPPASLLEQLRSDRRGVLRGARRILPDDDGAALLVIDQFEELFTLCDDEGTRSSFLEAIHTAVTDPASSLRVVLTLRADFYDQPLRYGEFADLLKHRGVTITPLAPDELQRAIVAPAEACGVVFEPGLVAEIVADVASQPGGLPLLQYALTELFERRVGGVLTADAYRDMGGMTGALAARADERFEAAGAEEQVAVRRLFGRLVTLGEGTEDTRRRVRRSELTGGASMAAAIERYAAARLLTFDRDASSREPTLEVAHEALIREWPRLRAWLDEDRDDLRVHRHLTGTARSWDEIGRDPGELYRGGRLEVAEGWAARNPDDLNAVERDFLDASIAARLERERLEQHRVRRLRRLLTGVAAALVVAVAAGALALQQRAKADDEAAAADAARAAAETRRMSADAVQVQSSSAELGLLLAAEAHRRDPSVETLGAIQRTLVGAGQFLGLRGAGRTYRDVEWSPDGQTVYAMREGAIDALDVAGTADREVYRGTTFSSFAISPDGRDLAVATRTAEVRVVDIETGATRRALPLEGNGAAVAFSADGRRLVVGDSEGWLHVFDATTGDHVGSTHAHPELAPEIDVVARHEPLIPAFGIDSLAITSDSTSVVTTGTSFVRLWRVDDLELIWETAVTRPQITDATALVPGNPGDVALDETTGELFVAVQRVVQVFDLADGTLLRSTPLGAFAGTIPRNFDLALTGDLVVTASVDGLVRRLSREDLNALGDVDDAGFSGSFEGHDVAASPDGSTLASATQRGVRLLALDGRTIVSRTSELPAGAGTVVATRDGRFVVSMDLVAPPVVTDLASATTRPIEVPDAFWLHPDGLGGPTVWARAGDQMVGAVVDLVSGAVIREGIGPFGGVALIRESPDGRFYSIGSNPPELVGQRIFAADDLRSPIVELRPPIETQPVANGGIWSPDGSRFIGTFSDGLVIGYDATTWQPIEPFIQDGGTEINAAAFSPDGDVLVLLDREGVLRVHDGATFAWTGVSVQVGSGGPPSDFSVLEFTADGRYLVASAPVHQLVDVATWSPVGDPLPGSREHIYSVPVGARFVPTVVGQVAHLWTIDPDRWPELACLAAGRNLTMAEWEQFGPAGEPYRVTCPQWPAPSAPGA